MRVGKGMIGYGMLPLLTLLFLLPGSVMAGTEHRLADAVENKDIAAVRTLLKERVNVNEPQGDGTTALHWAAHWNDLETAELLIRAGANMNAVTDLGVTPLYLAVEIASAALTEKLLTAGANPNAAPETGVTPLMIAARAGSGGVVKALLGHKADVNAKENTSGQTALMWAAAQGHAAVVQMLLEHGADVHARTRTITKVLNRGGSAAYDDFSAVADVPSGASTALLFAAGRGQIEVAKQLLEFGSDVNETGADGISALVVAAHSGQGAFAAFLLDRGADANADGGGYTVLHAAVLLGDYDLVKAALSHKANSNLQVRNGTPYRRQSADYFLQAGDVGATPLLLAAKFGSADMIRALAAAGANLELAGKDGSTALVVAANAADNKRQSQSEFLNGDRVEDERDSREAVKALLDLGADIDAVNQAGDTAVHVAVAGRSDTIIQLLAERGARLDIKNKRGLTPMGLLSAGSGRRGGGAAREAGGAAQPSTTAELLRKLGAQ